ncbi:MAG: polysaccharide biosynthesis tyrosine autokinase [Pigmentiphaga sp.]|uniref:polysaccharide biosynthesis tyrosine autokinase n=1 Tax=Pigmentiphaga sp. TaxID=1977564 RepID=UPI0029AB380C|nr:polysaccharide biosynthesis tyrosine autokinase [Pigmentiphaga sp.]MDX3905539.1 polysaccharide biosynthesis tyrosine autokinase [Pigmentiphaga sp.]
MSSYLDAVVARRWSILGAIVLTLALAGAYLLLTPPVYRADILVQVEEEQPTSTARTLLGDVSAMFDVKPATSGEMEVLRSRTVVRAAVDRYLLYIDAAPDYFPIVGRWLAQRDYGRSVAQFLPPTSYAWADEKIVVGKLEVPRSLLTKKLEVTALGGGRYRLVDRVNDLSFEGRVGRLERFVVPDGPIEIQIDELTGAAGTDYTVRRRSRLMAEESVQAKLGVFERGRQSGVIGVTFEGSDPVLTAAILNEIGREYVQQNVNRRAEQAEKSLAFLDSQLPSMKKALDEAESRYNALRNSRGTIDLSEEAKLILAQSTEAQTRVVELRARRSELDTRFAKSHPAIVAIDQQIASLNADINRLGGRIRQLPDLEQDVVRLVRDVRVNTELYTALLNNTQQLKLIRAGKVGNVRLLDTAVVPEEPVEPKPSIVLAVAGAIGLIAGTLLALMRNALFGGLSDPDEAQRYTGLRVLGTIPYSEAHERLWRHSLKRNSEVQPLLAQKRGKDPSIESLRAFRTIMQKTLQQSVSNVMVFTGPVPGVGKSFLSANFAFIQGAVGKRVLLIDADFRKGQLNRYFNLPKGPGLFEVLAGTTPVEKVSKHSVAEGVDFISTGVVTFDPSELLASSAFAPTLNELSRDYDLVIVDTAPVLSSSDAAAVGVHAAAVVIVVRDGMNTVGEIRETAKRLMEAGAPVDGLVFNGLKLLPKRYGFRPKYGNYRYARADYYGDEAGRPS